MIRIATYNLENLFMRPVAMNGANDTLGRTAIEDHAAANAIVSKETYTQADKNTLIRLTKKHKWHELNAPKNAMVRFVKIRGQLFKKSGKEGVSIAANGRADWVGWFELITEDVNWKATYNTGRVIKEVKPDILITVEVENRPTLEKFNKQVLKAQFKLEYPHTMVIDGNDDRGIDLGIMSKFPIVEIRSHIDDINPKGLKTFSRDCPEYDILLPGGKRIVILPNHYKSKRNGDDTASVERRVYQGKGTHAIALAALKRTPYVLICGDLNDTPDSKALKEVIKGGFVDVQDHPDYPKDMPGTYAGGLAGNKIDYLIMSKELRKKLTTTGIERRGTYHPKKWKSFDTVTKSSEEASDHHLVWGDFGL